MTERIEFRARVAAALNRNGVSFRHESGGRYSLPADTLLTGRQVSAAVKADPERLAARYNERCSPEYWTGTEWQYVGHRPSMSIYNPEYDELRDERCWHLVYRDPKPQPQVFHTLAEYVAYAEHPDRIGQVSGVDVDGEEVGVYREDDGTVGFGIDTVRLPITAIEPIKPKTGADLRRWLVANPLRRVYIDGVCDPSCGVWWDANQCDYFTFEGSASVEDYMSGVPASGNWND